MVDLPELRIELIEFLPRKVTSNHRVIGYASVILSDSGMDVYGIRIVQRSRDLAVAHLPTCLVLQADSPARDESGSLVFRPTVRFRDHRRYVEFSERVVALCRAANPEAFAFREKNAPMLFAAG